MKIPSTYSNFSDYIVTFGGHIYARDYTRAKVEITNLEPDNTTTCKISDLPKPVFAQSTIKTIIGVINCGGWDPVIKYSLKRCWKLENDNSWSPFPNMTQERYAFVMGEANNRLVAIGGVGGSWISESMEWIRLDGRNNEHETSNTQPKWTKQWLQFEVTDNSCLSKYNDTHLLLTGGYEGNDTVYKVMELNVT